MIQFVLMRKLSRLAEAKTQEKLLKIRKHDCSLVSSKFDSSCSRLRKTSKRQIKSLLREFNFFAEMKKIFAKIEIALLFQDLKSDRFVDNGLEKTLLMLLLLLLQLLLLPLLLLLLLL